MHARTRQRHKHMKELQAKLKERLLQCLAQRQPAISKREAANATTRTAG